ncbi:MULTISPECIES: YybH family protein [unclassified Geodermatophilus]|uniref:YybH family protein n=1 Tax=unclassified Geodermatophilus TaxID=2637632 RepID=UPI003EEC00C3
MDPDFTATLERTAKALQAMGSGDPGPYAALWARSDDVTLFGAWGPIEKGHEAVTTTFQWVGSRFSDGGLTPTYDVVEVRGDLAYTVGMEKGVVRVDGGEPRPMTIRATHVYRRLDGQWWLVHRHADFPPPDQRRS